MKNTNFNFGKLPWLTIQITAAILFVTVLIGVLGLLTFQYQSTEYLSRLMQTFSITPGSLHAMYVEDVRSELWRNLIITGLIALSLALVLGWWLVRPIYLLAEKTAEVARGNYAVRAPHLNGEVGKLAEDFNTMVETLDRQEQLRKEFVANIAHEIRTPLTTLRGYIEGIEDGIFQADPKTMATLKDEVDHLSVLTRRIDNALLLDHEQVNGECDFSVLARASIERWQPSLDIKGLKLDCQIADGLTLPMNETAARQVLDNLLSNVEKYADAKGEVVFKLELSKARGAQLTISNAVTDFPPNGEKYLFDRMYRADQSRTRLKDDYSAGLGLAIVRDIVVAAGGTITARLNDTADRLIIQARF